MSDRPLCRNTLALLSGPHAASRYCLFDMFSSFKNSSNDCFSAGTDFRNRCMVVAYVSVWNFFASFVSVFSGCSICVFLKGGHEAPNLHIFTP